MKRKYVEFSLTLIKIISKRKNDYPGIESKLSTTVNKAIIYLSKVTNQALEHFNSCCMTY